MPAKKTAKTTEPTGMLAMLQQRIIGQTDSFETILPYIQMYDAGIAPVGRPAGIFLLLGSTGVGKTESVKAIANVLHGTDDKMLRVDCGEFQMEHEVAKLISAPPGYLGHRETVAMLTQQKLALIKSETSSLSIVLFDEIEKAAPSFTRILLGILDRGILTLGDNTQVNFEKTMIFMTSNLGSKELDRSLKPFGLTPPSELTKTQRHTTASEVCKRRFPAEFMNRIDAVVSYERLTPKDLAQILDLELNNLQLHLYMRLKGTVVTLSFSRSAKDFLLKVGTSKEYGARELKRAIQKHVTQKFAGLLFAGAFGGEGTITVVQRGEGLAFMSGKTVLAAA